MLRRLDVERKGARMRMMKVYGCIAAMAAGVLASSIARAEGHPATVSTRTVFVQASSAEYMDTGLKLERTDMIVIRALGRIRTRKRRGLTNAWGAGRLASDRLWEPRPGALVARVGQLSFSVGGLYHGDGAAGKLELRVHDDKHADNSGSYLVFITVISRKDGRGADFVGVPECDEYIERYAVCLKDNVPEAQQAVMARSLETMRAAWKKAAYTEVGKRGLGRACKTALGAAAKSMAAFKCDWGIR
jgi:hypothetical protein